MSIADMAVISIKGGFDVFDKARGKIEGIRALIDADVEENGPTIEYHPGEDSIFSTIPPHSYSVQDALKHELDEAIRLIDSAEVIACEVLAAV